MARGQQRPPSVINALIYQMKARIIPYKFLLGFWLSMNRGEFNLCSLTSHYVRIWRNRITRQSGRSLERPQLVERGTEGGSQWAPTL